MKRNPFLRVKLKSLAEEARIIRKEERRANAHRDFALQRELRDHRAGVVRREARATLLAYQFLRGKPFTDHIPNKQNPVDWDAVGRMVKRYGGKDFDPEQWMTGCLTANAA